MQYIKGEFTIDGVTYGALMTRSKNYIEALLINSGTVISAHKVDTTGSYSFNTDKAEKLVKIVQAGLKSCSSKNCNPVPFVLGACNQHEFTKNKMNYIIQLYSGELVGAYINSDNVRIEMEYFNAPSNFKFPDINYIALTQVSKSMDVADSDLDSIPTRSVQEIALTKEDLTWLQNKKYYIVNDDNTAEQLFSFLDNYNKAIAYDVETTGLKINCFGQIGSHYKDELDKYNEEHPDDRIRADKLVGIIFCVEENTSYYFPCFNRKFKNLYEDKDSPIRNRIIKNTKMRYTMGDLRNEDTPARKYWMNTKDEDITSDCILMERVRDILEKKHIVSHGGSFEYKTGLQYSIDTNIKDDSMILHQVAFKFSSGAAKAEPSNLKYLSKTYLGIDQWELKDFFPMWKEDKLGLVRNKPGTKNTAANQIDFSYMDYEGTRVYAPTDGDCTLCLFKLFKSTMLRDAPQMEYIYNIEIEVMKAVGYMEFYGHRIDMSKILSARSHTIAKKVKIESQIRQAVSLAEADELAAFNELEAFEQTEKTCGLSEEDFGNKLIEYSNKLEEAIEKSENKLNIDSPAQMCELFYDKLGYPLLTEKQSVAKKVYKAWAKEKNSDGTLKYPVAKLYQSFKNESTLLSKFFDNLIYFTYPGGFIFSSFGQIATNTGRMSCSKPNCQQYPKVITKIIIPRSGYVMIDADYSQIEYRVLTALAHNDWLAELFSDPDSDYHTLMASLMYGVEYSAVTPEMRSAAKSFNFGIPYGMGLGSLAILLTGVNTPKTRDEAAEKMEDYFRNQPKTKLFFQNIKEMAQVNGYTKTLFGRIRTYQFTDKDGKVNNAKRAQALRQAGNAVIQGCLHGDTKIETKEFGIKPIKELVGYSGLVWNGTDWTNGDILYSGKKQKCVITFANGQKFVCSPTHKFLEFGGDATNIEDYIECKDLKSNHYVQCNMRSSLKVDDFDEFISPSIMEIEYEDEDGNNVYELVEIDDKDRFLMLRVESVEITDEYIDMYDVCNTDEGYYIADGIVTHNTAADIFKIGVARNFNFIRRNKLLGKVLIVNMVHDEQLMEVDAQNLNVQRVLAEVGDCMQFKIDEFPPLYIGAGIGKAWGYAKGKMAEIHPVLLQNFTEEAKSIPLFRTPEQRAAEPVVDTQKVLDYFENRVYQFRRQKVIDYITNPENFNKVLHPAISALINLQFNYGRGDDPKAYVGPNGETYDAQGFLELNLIDFIKENNLNVDASLFRAQENVADAEEDTEYEDSEENEDDVELYIDGDNDLEKQFKLIDESNKTFGATINDMIDIFNACVLTKQKVCGVKMKGLYYKKKDAIIDYLATRYCEADADGALQVVLLNDGNILKYTDVYVKDVKQSELERIYNIKHFKDSNYTAGDVNNRSQAK